MDSIFPWLSNIYKRLVIADLSLQLPGIPFEGKASDKLAPEDKRKMILAASALSLSEQVKDRKMAYEIASRLLELEDHDESLVAAADIIFSRLGNFPGRQLLRELKPNVQGAPSRLSLERLAREFENTIDLGGGREACLTDFQFALFEALGESSSFSVSAPTSAGKSFVLGLDLVRRLHRRQESVIYLVPTRALIREVSHSVRNHLREAGLEVPVRTVPFPVAKESCPNGLIYVLTQERLMSLLAAASDGVWVTTLIVDEAHNIQDDVRGVVLQAAIERVTTMFPSTKVYFASPLSANPEKLLEIARRPTKNSILIDRLSPVAQNIILVREVRGKRSSARFSLLTGEEEIDLGSRVLNYELRGDIASQKAAFARSITGDDESTIIFTNDASSAESTAKSICSKSTQLVSVSQAINELIDFIKTDVHSRYPLIDCLPHGVAYHYGDMPPLVRARVEDLFKSGEVRYLCCTSTLLQGVNLPARHIIIEDPRRGRSGPMPRRDFLNLAGRAGRLLREFHGNIWCIRPEKWADPVYQGPELTTISSAVDIAMIDGGVVVHQVTRDEKIKEKTREFGDAILGKLYLDSVQNLQNFSLEKWRTETNSEALSVTEEILRSIKVTLPLGLLESNAGIRPDRLQILYDYLAGLSSKELIGWMPLGPWVSGYYDRMKATIKLVELTLRDRDNESYKFYAWLASKWIHGVPLGEIISANVDGSLETEALSKQIRQTLKTLESEIRFRLVKHYVAFCSVLRHALEKNGQSKLANEIEPFHIYLECGAASPSLLGMISLGLSRSTAIATDRKARIRSGSLTPEELLSELKRIDIELLDIPGLCKRELRELTGG
ncbi:DEAD/DEAH box helicase [Xanthomonas protegens]|uniref:DEAD/DEAH box helicase n=1 Tax=Xanthomonas protegens TaxID=3380705 RepID=A0ABU9LI49_9XANT